MNGRHAGVGSWAASSAPRQLQSRARTDAGAGLASAWHRARRRGAPIVVRSRPFVRSNRPLIGWCCGDTGPLVSYEATTLPLIALVHRPVMLPLRRSRAGYATARAVCKATRRAMRRAACPLLMVGVSLPTVGVAQAPFTIAGVSCDGGSRCRTHLTVPSLGADTAVRLPVTVLHGARPGPLLTLTAGVHGGEYAPILAAQRVGATVDPRQLTGTIVIVHAANPTSLYGRGVYYTPTDGRNLNRMFPGRADGTLSERTAHVIFAEIIRRADAYLDLHCGDANEALRPYVATRVSGDSAYDARVRSLAIATGLTLLLETPVPSPVPNPPGTTTMTAAVHRIPGFTVEWGMLGRTDESSVNGQLQAVLGVARAMGMLPGRPGRGGTQRMQGSRTAAAPVSGLVRVEVTLDQQVREGQRVAVISDLFGVQLAEVLAPVSGRVISFTATPPVRAGEPVVAIGIPAPK